MVEQVQQLEARVTQLEQVVQALLNQFLPPVTARLAALEQSTVTPAAPAKEKTKRHPTTYAMYQKVVALRDAGRTDKEIADQLGIPYTTVRGYFSMTAERIRQLKAKAEKESTEQAVEQAVAARVVEPTATEQTPVADDLHLPPLILTSNPMYPGWYEWPVEERQWAASHEGFMPVSADRYVDVCLEGATMAIESQPPTVVDWSRVAYWRLGNPPVVPF